VLIGIMRGEEGHMNPPPQFMIERGDRLFVLSP
jgi:voltage-gated potassium channel